MLEIRLIVELDDERDANDGPERARRYIKLDALPTVGHRIRADGHLLTVKSVMHDAEVTDREVPTTEVTCKIPLSTMIHLVGDNRGDWQMC